VPFATIEKALSSVSTGDHIVVAPGTYTEGSLDLSTSSVVIVCEPGTIIDSGGASACLTISASSCEVVGAVFHPSSASVGLDVQAGADYVTVDGCCACQCSVGFEIAGDAAWVRNCRSIEHSASGFDISSKYNRVDRCKAVGAGAAVRGFYLSNSDADFNQLLNCASVGNTTAGFETVAGANQNTFAFCASGGSDGGAVDNGSNNAWSGYAVDPALTQDDILSDGTPFDGANIDAAISSRSSHSAADVTGGTTVATAESNIRGTDSDTLKTLSDQLDGTALEATLTAIKGAGWTNETLKAIKDAVDSISGDATAANQTTIISHLTDIKGDTWTDETLVALKALLDALPTTAEVNAEVDTALADYDAPTKAEMDAAFTEIKQTTVVTARGQPVAPAQAATS